MKKVIVGEELKEVILEAINLLCKTVSLTLGPTGNNILINNSETSPFITNDGVTIAKNIESNDKRINTVLEIIKEASLKTNELVGDGTTTTLVLLENIYKEGLKEIENGKSPIIVKKELTDTLDWIIKKLEKNRIYPTKDNLASIASISANDKNIGSFLSNEYSKMQSKYAISLKESNSTETYTELKTGYSVETNNLSNLYFKKSKTLNLNNVYTFVIKGYLTDLESISDIINEGFNDKNILIFVEGIDNRIKEEVLVYYLTENKNIFLIELPEFASHKEKIEDDIRIISNCNIKNIDYEDVCFKDSGLIDNISITKDDVTLNVNKDNSKVLIETLKEELNNSFDDYEKEFIESRLAKLENGLLTIYVGGITKTEIKEKLMRYEDALCALDIAKKGITLGEGVTFLKISEEMFPKTSGDFILKKSLTGVIDKIVENTGVVKDIKKLIIESNFNSIYNFETDKLENISDTKIIDPLEVIIVALKNAVSIASLLLTTTSLVINENDLLEKEIL